MRLSRARRARALSWPQRASSSFRTLILHGETKSVVNGIPLRAFFIRDTLLAALAPSTARRLADSLLFSGRPSAVAPAASDSHDASPASRGGGCVVGELTNYTPLLPEKVFDDLPLKGVRLTLTSGLLFSSLAVQAVPGSGTRGPVVRVSDAALFTIVVTGGEESLRNPLWLSLWAFQRAPYDICVTSVALWQLHVVCPQNATVIKGYSLDVTTMVRAIAPVGFPRSPPRGVSPIQPTMLAIPFNSAAEVILAAIPVPSPLLPTRCHCPRGCDLPCIWGLLCVLCRPAGWNSSSASGGLPTPCGSQARHPLLQPIMTLCSK